MTEAFSIQFAERASQLLALLRNDVRAKRPIIAGAIPFLADLLREVENNGDRQAMVFACKFDKRPSRLCLHVRGIDDRQLRARQAFGADGSK